MSKDKDFWDIPDSSNDDDQMDTSTRSQFSSTVFGQTRFNNSSSNSNKNNNVSLFDMFPSDENDNNNITIERINQFSNSLNSISRDINSNNDSSMIDSSIEDDSHNYFTENSNTDNFSTEIFSNKTDEEVYYTILDEIRDIQQSNPNNDQNNSFLFVSTTLRNIATKKLELLNHQLEKNFFIQKKNLIDQQIISLNMEINTWDLIIKLYEYRDLTKDLEQEGDSEMNIDQDSIYQQLLKSNQSIREMFILIQWLQEMSSNLEFNDNIELWSKTFKQFKQQKMMNSSLSNSNNNSMANANKELDPDSTSRINLNLDEMDEKEENQFLIALWDCIRAGDNERAISLCKSLGQSWRSQTLIGWQKSNYQLESLGNPFNNLWRFNCHQLSDKAKNAYEKAIYGSLCGNLDPLLNVSKNWYDYLWSYLISLFNNLVYKELDQYKSPLALDEDLPIVLCKINPQINNTNDILNQLKSSSNLDIKAQSNNPYHVIQELIINDQYPLLLETLLKFLSSGNCSVEFQRFSINLIVFYRSRSGYTKDTSKNSPENFIIKFYIDYLIETKQNHLVALYTSYLSNSELAVKVYSDFLVSIKQENRSEALALADKYGLNTKDIARSIVMNNMTGNSNNATSNDNSTSIDDLNKISSIQWLTHEENLYIEAIVHSNELFREFILQNKLDACEKTVSQLPETIIPKAIESSQLENTLNIIKEYSDFKNYMKSYRLINLYNQNFSKKPQQPQIQLPLQSAQPIPYSMKLNYERLIKAYDNQFEEWNQLNLQFGKEAMQAIKDIIKSNWLCSVENTSNLLNEKDLYQKKSSQIRKKIIPQLFNSLFFIYTNTNQISKSTSIANKLADEKLKWYTTFTQTQLSDLISKIKDNFINHLSVESEEF